MYFLRPLVIRTGLRRAYSATTKAPIADTQSQSATSSTDAFEPPEPKSSCSANTVLTGLNYLKNQGPVQALADEEYPEWLWGILKPVVLPEDGPGGKAERRRMRQENRRRIKDQNFMRTQ